MTVPEPDSQSSAEAMIADHVGSLRTRLRQRLKSEADVQDLTQEACLRLLHTSRNQRIDNPRAYLLQIANRLLWHHYKVGSQFIDANVDLDHLPTTQPSPVDAAILETRQQLVEHAGIAPQESDRAGTAASVTISRSPTSPST